MDMHENKHCTETKFSCRYHYHLYKDNTQETACGEKDNPTRIQLRTKRGQWPTLDFEIPRQLHELERVERMMAYAYEQGQLDKMGDIRQMFKTIIGL